ncbi:MAG: hypothetical protein IJO46_06355, partial [Thermoguttaceae bacterium]|nr:hypothetical protein [Thermoguttaceae bacterium]
FRISEPRRLEIRVFQATKAPEFLAFTRDGATLYEPTLSFEAAPVYTPFSEIALGSAQPTPRDVKLEVALSKEIVDIIKLRRFKINKISR